MPKMMRHKTKGTEYHFDERMAAERPNDFEVYEVVEGEVVTPEPAPAEPAPAEPAPAEPAPTGKSASKKKAPAEPTADASAALIGSIDTLLANTPGQLPD